MEERTYYDHLSYAENRRRLFGEERLLFELEVYRTQLLADLEKLTESLSSEARQRQLRAVPELVEKGKIQTKRGLYRDAIRLLRQAYELEPTEAIREAVVTTYIAYGIGLLSVGDWHRVISELASLPEEGLSAGGIHYVLARASLMAFEPDGGNLQRLQKAMSEAEEAIAWEPKNPSFLTEFAKCAATYARWWKGAAHEDQYMVRYQTKAIQWMERAYAASTNEREIAGLLHVAQILEATGDLTQLLPAYLLDALNSTPMPQPLPPDEAE